MLQKLSRFTSLVLFLGALLILWFGLIDANHVNIVQDKERIENSIVKAMVECYSVEGFYPSNLDYLKEHYGLILNEDLYFIAYEYEGENLMPNIYVYRKGEDV